jgi:hypothetical protein
MAKKAKAEKTRAEKLAPRDVDTLAEERQNTSSSNRFSTYERVVNPDPWDGDLIIEHRGEPNKKEEPPA